jgi:dTDP-4-amino-4,6-dideoxygalactose transaminase
MQQRRREVVGLYGDAFRDADALELPSARPHVEHAWHLYVVRLRLDRLRIDREQAIRELAARNIGASVHFIPVHLHPWYRDRYGFVPGQFPVAYASYLRTLSLPLHPGLTDADVGDVVTALLDVLRKFRR